MSETSLKTRDELIAAEVAGFRERARESALAKAARPPVPALDDLSREHELSVGRAAFRIYARGLLAEHAARRTTAMETPTCAK